MEYCKDAYDIFIQAGQSNAEGIGKGPVNKEYEETEKIAYLTAEKTVEVRSDRLEIMFADEPFSIDTAKERTGIEGKIGDFSLTFAQSYIENGLLQKDRKVLIIRAGVGGTGFQKGYWTQGGELYLKLLEMCDYALSLNPENRIVGFLWHQGEHDAFEGNTPENYYKQLSELVNGVRSRYGNMSFIAGDFVNEWKSKNLDSCNPIVDTIKTVVKDIKNAGFVETADLPSNNQKIGNGDDIHFCRESLYELGRRYFKEFFALYQNS